MSYQTFTELPENAIHQLASPKAAGSAPVKAGSPASVLNLQRVLGNQQVGELIQAKHLTSESGIIGIQPKLTVGAADDQYEREADHVARRVISMPDPISSKSAQRAIPPEEDKDKVVQTKPLMDSIAPFAQRQTNAEEEKEVPVQAKVLNGASSSRSVQRECSGCDAAKAEHS